MSEVLIDGRAGWTGIGTYLSMLLNVLDSWPDLKVTLLLNSSEATSVTFKNIGIAETDIKAYSLKEQLQLNNVIKNLDPKIVHFPHINVPLFFDRDFIITIHDLTMLRFIERRETFPAKVRFFIKFLLLRAVVRSAVGRASKIIVPSDYVRDDLARVFPKSVSKTVTIYEGPGASYPPGGILPHALTKPYLLYVGNLLKHKNVGILLDAMEVISKTRSNLQLAIVGSGPEESFLKKRAGERSSPVHFFGRLEEETLGTLYKNAEIFVFPSLSEGFGLPPLEAIGNGVPVVSSNAACMPEILGEAALYFDPMDEEEMAAQIIKVLSDKDLRAELIKKGYEQVKKYSWEKMARQTIEIYKEGLEKKN